MADCGILVCIGESCHAELGKVAEIKISKTTKLLGMWDLEKVRIAGELVYFSATDRFQFREPSYHMYC